MKRSYLFVLFAGLIGFGLAYWLSTLQFFDRVEWSAEDLRYRVTAPPPADPDEWSAPSGMSRVVIVAIDDRTIGALRNEVANERDAALKADATGTAMNAQPFWRNTWQYAGMQWPYPPGAHARVAAKAKEWGARAIGFYFPMSSGWPKNLYGEAFNTAEIEKLRDIADPSFAMVFATTPVPAHAGTVLQPPLWRLLENPHVSTGVAAIATDPDEVVRFYPLVYPLSEDPPRPLVGLSSLEVEPVAIPPGGAAAGANSNRAGNAAGANNTGAAGDTAAVGNNADNATAANAEPKAATLPSFALELVRRADGVQSTDGNTQKGTFADRRTLVDRDWAHDGPTVHAGQPEPLPDLKAEVLPLSYFGPPGTFPTVSYVDMLNGRLPPRLLEDYGCSSTAARGIDPETDLFRGRIVIIAPTSVLLHAGHKTPMGIANPTTAIDPGTAPIVIEDDGTGWARMSEGEIEANAVQMLSTAREDVAYTRADPAWNLQLLIATCLVVVLIVALLPPIASIPAFLLVCAGLVFGTTWWFDSQNTMFNVVPPLAGAIMTFGFGAMANYLTERKEKRAMKKLFGKYVSPSVVSALTRHPKMAALGGEKRELSILFADLASFTTWAEPYNPDILLELMNEYFSAMSAEIISLDGTVDKFIGDAIMAFWNAPQKQKDHAIRACRAALNMRKRIRQLNEEWQSKGRKPLFFRIGIHTGEVIVGNAGSKDRFEYTAIGDAVNLASRLEATGKFYGVNMIISQQTKEEAGDEFSTRLIDKVRVKGRAEPVAIYELVGYRKEVEANAKLGNFVNTFHQGMRAYLAREWNQAIVAFDEAARIDPDDGPVRVFRARCRRFQGQPPPENWDGSIELTRKD